ncbi:MAG: quinolinate synthase NadA [Verrucomicrobia bacterium]|jgi:quinolinate synthase|nr:quinolinate synthase NadA [Verrucomicrobiota bacterium]
MAVELPAIEPKVFPPRREDEPLSALQKEILELKDKRNAIILAHNYQIEPIQRLADYLGDSLGLSYAAAEADADVILFCGVHFMAETAKIINPGKTVLLPDENAGCSLSDSCPAEKLQAYQEQHPGLYTVAYINCSAAVKARSDLICTSGNAVRMIEKIPADREILFVPDQNLGSWVARQSGRRMRLWPGSCYAHVLFTARALERIRADFPDAPVVAHPECTEAVRDLADEVCSTEKMIAFCRETAAQRIIVATETGMIHRLQRDIPEKTFIAGPTETCACNECRFMKMNTLEKVRDALRNGAPEIHMEESLRQRAAVPIERMLEWSRS